MKATFDAAGDVRAVDLLAAFVSMWREKRSGSLRFSRGGSSAGYDLADGEIVAVFSSEPRFETSAILVRAGKLDASALERLSMPPGTDAALAALQTGILTRREWKWGEKIRAIEILADLLTWPDGKYLFDSDARPERGEFVLSVPRLLLELFLRSRDRNLVEHQLGPADVPLRRSENFDEEFATFGLTADAESVVQLIDGGATATEISERAPAEEFAVLKLLAALTTLGLLRPDSAPPAGEPEPAAPQLEPSEAPPPPFEAWSGHESRPGIPVEEPATTKPLDEISLNEAEPEPTRVVPEPAWEPAPSEPQRQPGPSVDWPSHSPEDWRDREAFDQPLVAEPEALVPSPPKRRSRGWIAAALFVFLLAAIGGTVLLRSRLAREGSPPPAVTARIAPTAAPPAPSPVPTALPAATPIPPSPAARAAATPVKQRAIRPTPATPVSAARPSPPPVPVARDAGSDSSRSAWLERARRDRRRLQSDKKTRYAIQLELVCETPSLAEAWKHDRPPGTLWLLAETHRGRECFRVLWGRYGSIDEAKQAKSGIPAYFATSSNHPAVVGVR